MAANSADVNRDPRSSTGNMQVDPRVTKYVLTIETTMRPAQGRLSSAWQPLRSHVFGRSPSTIRTLLAPKASPASASYLIGSPLFTTVTIKLNPAYYPGGSFVIEATNNSATNQYIQSANLNGQVFTLVALDHATITQGGTLMLNMGSSPATWGNVPTSAKAAPNASVVNEADTSTPYYQAVPSGLGG